MQDRDSLKGYLFGDKNHHPFGNRVHKNNPRSVSTNPLRRDVHHYYEDQPATRLSDNMNRSYFTNSGFVYGPPAGGGVGGGSVASLSPFHVAAKPGLNNVVAVGTKTKSLSLLIDRSGNSDYNYNPKRMGLGGTTGGSNSRDQSLDRQLNYPLSEKKRDFYSIGNRWERASADREYSYPPNLGTGTARSLERDNQYRTHSFSEAGTFLRGNEECVEENIEPPSPQAFYTNADSNVLGRDGFILDLQAQIADLNKECAILQQDLDLTRDKLNSTMNSIKSFWSPELKKERNLRKDENLKYVSLNEQLKAAEIENRQHLTNLMKLEQENRSLRESLPSHLPTTNIAPTTSSTGTGVVAGEGTPSINTQTISTTFQTPSPDTSQTLESVKRDRDRLAREAKLLRRTMQEMEMRIDTQQRTMSTRDSTIQKLMDLLQQQQQQQQQSASESIKSENKEARTTTTTTSNNKEEELLKNKLQQKCDELSRMSQELEANKQIIDSLRCQERNLNEKLETSKLELKRSDTEHQGLNSRLGILQKHMEEHEKHISNLTEQNSAKEQQIKLLQGDIEVLRLKLEEKESLLSRKNKQTITLQTDKSAVCNQLTEVTDKYEDAVAKIKQQARKIESLEESLKDKDMVIHSTRHQLDAVKMDRSSTDSALVNLQEVVEEKEKQVVKLRQSLNSAQKELEESTSTLTERLNEFKVKVSQLQEEVINKQEVELELKDEIGRLKSEISTKDALVSKMEVKVNEVEVNFKESQVKLNKAKEDFSKLESRMEAQQKQHITDFEAAKKEINQSKVELDRLKLENNRLAEEVAEKKEKICKLEQEVVTLSRNKVKGGAGAGGGDDDGIDDVSVFKSILSEKDGRIEELENAMKESIKIMAQREVVMAEQQMKLEHTERLMESLQEEIESTKKSLEECRQQLFKSDNMLKEKDSMLRGHLNDSKKQLSEVYEMKQEAILAAISEKDAHIALLEMAPNKKTENIDEVERLTKEKAKLQQVLKDLTQSRMKLLQSRGHMRSSSASSLLHYATHRDAIMQKVDFGTYYVYHNELLNEDDDSFL